MRVSANLPIVMMFCVVGAITDDTANRTNSFPNLRGNLAPNVTSSRSLQSIDPPSFVYTPNSFTRIVSLSLGHLLSQMVAPPNGKSYTRWTSAGVKETDLPAPRLNLHESGLYLSIRFRTKLELTYVMATSNSPPNPILQTFINFGQ
ncbi:unnamed protein product [Linum trigynum]|uniref:Uncharacterized protein n=1 Tax=Linum trigynum TaxID=586398 RepID=A0AAV2CCZ9_9ROSI